MPKLRSGHLIIGVALAIMGFAVLVIAFSRHAERTWAAAQRQTDVANCCAPQTASAPSAPLAAASASTASGVAASDAAVDAPALDATADSGAADAAPDGDDRLDGEATDARTFKFFAGGASMRWDEQQRLTNLARAVARHPAVRLTLEAFGDTPGTDALNVGIAKHRLKTAQAIMNRAGLSDERLTLLTSDVTVDPRFARSIRLTSAPPLSEVEKP